jgi:hypothetical protein
VRAGPLVGHLCLRVQLDAYQSNLMVAAKTALLTDMACLTLSSLMLTPADTNATATSASDAMQPKVRGTKTQRRGILPATLPGTLLDTPGP